MPSVFSKVISGEWPGRFVYADERVVAFLTIAPLRPGHVLVVPREEVDHWEALDPDLAAHLMTVAQKVGRAVKQAFGSARAGLVVAGLEVPHTHLHVVPLDAMRDLDFAHADPEPDPLALDAAAARIRAALGEDASDRP